MFKNYLKTGWRNIRRQKGYSIINIAGLALGMACAVLIVFYIHHELSFDRFHEKADRIFRVVNQKDECGCKNSRSFYSKSSAIRASKLIDRQNHLIEAPCAFFVIDESDPGFRPEMRFVFFVGKGPCFENFPRCNEVPEHIA
jgi:hypothetical protein